MLPRVSALPRLAMVATLASCALGAVASAAGPVEQQRLQPPTPIDPSSPAYPEGRDVGPVVVTVRVEIDPRGDVTDAWVREVEPRSAGGVFVSAALDHVRSMQFEPGRLDGEPVEYAYDLSVRFDPDEEPSVPAANGAPAEPQPNEAEAQLQSQPESVESGSASADAPHPEEAGVEDETRTVVVQTDPAPRRRETTGADFDIDPGKLSAVPRTSAEEMLTLAPGIFLSNAGGEFHPSGVFLRGFDAGIGQDIEFTVDGVPINEPSNAHNHGFADTSYIIPELIERLRVIEGPYDARQGDFAVAGSVDYDLGLPYRGVMVRGGYGRFNAARAMVAWGPEDFGPGTYVGVDFNRGDGFGPNRSYRSARALAGFEHRLGKGFTLTLTAAGFGAQFDQAGPIRRDDFEARRNDNCGPERDEQFFCYYDSNQGGSSQRFNGMTRITRHVRRADGRGSRTFTQNLWVTRRNMRFRNNFTGFITDIRTDGGPQRGDGLELSYDTVTVGARGSYAMRRDFWTRPQELELGWGVRYDDGRTASRRLRFDDAVPYKTEFDSELSVVDASLYAASMIRPADRLEIGPGLRVDAFSFSTVDQDRPEMDREGERLPVQSQNAYGFSVQPRITMAVELLSWPRIGGAWEEPDANWRVEPGFGGLHWLSAYGVGTRSSDAIALSQGEFAPFARVQSAETGLRLSWDGIGGLFGFDARAMTFYTHVQRDLVFDETQARNVAVGESNRYGAMGIVRAKVASWLDSQVSVTWAEAHLPPSDAGAFDWSAGPRLPYVPRLVVRGDATVFHDFWIRNQPFDYSIAAGVSHVAPRPLPLGTFGTRYTVVDLGARLRWRWIEGGIEVQNLFDSRYHQFELFYPSNFESPSARPSMLPALHFVAGPPLTAMGTLTLYFEADHRARHRQRVRLHRLEQENER